MNLKYRMFINYISFIFGFLLFGFLYMISSNSFCLMLLIIYIVYYICLFNIGSFMKKHGRKKKGIVIDSCFVFRSTFFSNRGLVAYVDGDLYYICGLIGCKSEKLLTRRLLKIPGVGICNNKAYKYVCSEFEKVEDLGNGEFKLKSFPIDVYVYKDKYYFDLDSVKLDKKDL